MDLQSTKLCILFGLLISTSIAAMIPLLLIRTVEEADEEECNAKKSGRKKRGIWEIIKNWFPCCRKKRRNRLLSRFSIKTTSMRSSSTNGGHAHDMDVHGRRTTVVMSILNCFAGGVFLGTSFLGLMPEVREIFDEAGIEWPQLIPPAPVNVTNSTEIEETDPDLLPMTEIVVTCGLFLILIVEQSVHEILSWHNRKCAKARKASQVSSTSANLPEDETKLTLTSSCNNSGLELKKLSPDHNGTVVVCHDGESPTTVAVPNSPQHDSHSIQQPPEIEDENEHHVVRSLILVVSLSMHSFLEGIAIGLQSQASSAVSIFVAVLLHKSLMAFSMGTSLVKAKQSKGRVIKAAILFSVMSPIGIAVGMIMKSHVNHPNTDMVNAVLQGLATGTFLYITFFEVLAREFEAHGSRIQKTIALVLGYVSIFLMVMTQHGT